MIEDKDALSEKIKKKIDDSIIESTVSTIKTIKKLTEKEDAKDKDDENVIDIS